MDLSGALELLLNSGIFWILVDKNTVLGETIVTDKQIKFAGFRSDLSIVASANQRTVPKVLVNKMASIGTWSFSLPATKLRVSILKQKNTVVESIVKSISGI